MTVLPSYIKFADDPDLVIGSVIEKIKPDKVALLVDENTKSHCLPRVKTLKNKEIIEIKSGEHHKTLTTCELVWRELTELKFSRKSLLINLGGGVIGDLGGFVASTYKRGIRFVNVPTTLLSQVDASIGGKLGVDFLGLKNHIGVFKIPDAVVLWEGFLDTLPQRELRSGFAEVLKHGLIWDLAFWEEIKDVDFPDFKDLKHILKRSVEIKNDVVSGDPFESGQRKILNFGHTLGHAVETWYLERGKSLLHGEAIAVGMIMESYLSRTRCGLTTPELDEITNCIIGIYGKIEHLPALEDLHILLQQDKKNVGITVNFSLLDKIGKCVYDQQAGKEEVRNSVQYYQSL